MVLGRFGWFWLVLCFSKLRISEGIFHHKLNSRNWNAPSLSVILASVDGEFSSFLQEESSSYLMPESLSISTGC